MSPRGATTASPSASAAASAVFSAFTSACQSLARWRQVAGPSIVVPSSYPASASACNSSSVPKTVTVTEPLAFVRR